LFTVVDDWLEFRLPEVVDVMEPEEPVPGILELGTAVVIVPPTLGSGQVSPASVVPASVVTEIPVARPLCV